MNLKTLSKQRLLDVRLGEEDQAVLSSVEEILTDIRAGKPVIIVDDESRENEGDLIIAAEMATPDAINFMAREGRGLICLPMERAMIERLDLQLMGRGNNTRHTTAFTVSIEAKEGVTTGISAADRAHTIKVAIDPASGSADIASPGHVFPLLARDGGVLVRAGHTEAAVDLAKAAGFSGAGVICEIMNDDGTMARLPDLVAYAQRHGLKIGTIADLIAWRRQRETLVRHLHSSPFESRYGGAFTLHLYSSTIDAAEHVALVKGQIDPNEPILVRMHALDILSDALGQGDNMLQKSMRAIERAGQGVLVLLREGAPSRLSERLKASGGKKQHMPEPVLRHYGIGAQILQDLSVGKMTLISSHPKNVVGLDGYGLEIAGYRDLENEP